MSTSARISIVREAEYTSTLGVSSLERKTAVLSVNFAGIESTRASGIARLLPLQTYVSEVGSLHRQCKIMLQAKD